MYRTFRILLIFLWSMIMSSAASASEACPTVKFATSKGDILIEMFCDEAPLTTENFLRYVRDGFYDGTIFHRVIPGFVIQGGGFEPGMSQKPTRGNIRNEADNGIKNTVGSLSMARTPDPHSASSQFFINLKDNAFLDFKSETPQGWGYAVFARVVDGMEVVEEIAGVETGNAGSHQDVPDDDIVIETATVQE